MILSLGVMNANSRKVNGGDGSEVRHIFPAELRLKIPVSAIGQTLQSRTRKRIQSLDKEQKSSVKILYGKKNEILF